MSVVRDLKILGISASTSSQVVSNLDLKLIGEEDRLKLIKATGIERRRHVRDDQTTVDLCEAAGRKLLESLAIQPAEVGALFFVTQTPDYLFTPASAPLLQHRLGLPRTSACFDITLGCSGFTYGLHSLASFLSANQIRYGLLLAGDTSSKQISHTDKSSYPLFGDAGSACLVEYSPGAAPIWADYGTDGSGAQAIIIPEGGYRTPFNDQSLSAKEIEPGISRTPLDLILDGIEVFNFSVKQIPLTVENILKLSGNTVDEIDIFAFHQANLLMNELMRKKLKVPPEKMPYSLKDYGNTSSASIPMTLVTQRSEMLKSRKLKILASGFGVGLSWSTLIFETDRIVCPPLIEI